MENQLPVNLTNPSDSDTPDSLLRIEQEDWGKDVGILSKKDALDYILDKLVPGFGDPFSGLDCGMDDQDCVRCNIFAYPAYLTLNYILQASHGSVSGGRLEWLDEEELLLITGDVTATLKHPVQAIISHSWQGVVFDSELVPTNQPVVKVEGRTVSLSKPVYGKLLVKYKGVRFLHVLTVPPRITAQENKYACTVYGRYSHGISHKITQPPPNADTNAPVELGASRICGRSMGTDGSDDDYTPPVAPHEDKTNKIEYCSQEPME